MLDLIIFETVLILLFPFFVLIAKLSFSQIEFIFFFEILNFNMLIYFIATFTFQTQMDKMPQGQCIGCWEEKMARVVA